MRYFFFLPLFVMSLCMFGASSYAEWIELPDTAGAMNENDTQSQLYAMSETTSYIPLKRCKELSNFLMKGVFDVITKRGHGLIGGGYGCFDQDDHGNMRLQVKVIAQAQDSFERDFEERIQAMREIVIDGYKFRFRKVKAFGVNFNLSLSRDGKDIAPPFEAAKNFFSFSDFYKWRQTVYPGFQTSKEAFVNFIRENYSYGLARRDASDGTCRSLFMFRQSGSRRRS